MKTRSLALLLVFVVASTVFVCLVSNQRPTFHSIIAETHKRFKNLTDNLKGDDHRELSADPKYLEALGFTAHPRLVQSNRSSIGTGSADLLPVLVTGVASGQVEEAAGFVRSCRHFLPDHSILIYSLGLDSTELNTLSQQCNSSTCSVRLFNFDFYPSHVSDLSIYAHRPLVIQDALNQVGAILWLDVSHRLTTGNLDAAYQRARQHGVASWGIDQPTSALTHPRMFDYFHTQQENYYFLRMVEPAHVVLLNTPRIHAHLMLPWVQCSLIRECIAPIGAQRSGCRFDKKPLYRYSGCHRYDTSAFNVVLGLMFDFDYSVYFVEDHVFRLVDEDLGEGGEENSTNLNARADVF